MYNVTILDTGLNQVTSINKGDQEYPYSVEQQLYINNGGTEDLESVTVSVKPALSVKNFSTPALINEAKIQSLFSRIYFNYAELLFVDDGKVMDIANFPGKEITPVIDEDGYCRNVLQNVKIKFNHLSHNGNSRIYLSDAHYLAGVSKDISGSAEGYQRKIKFDTIYAGERQAFWYKFFLRKDMTGEKNPHIFNLLIKGE